MNVLAPQFFDLSQAFANMRQGEQMDLTREQIDYKRRAEADAAQRDQMALAALGSLLSGGGQPAPPAPPSAIPGTNPAQAAGQGGFDLASYMQRAGMAESGNNPMIDNTRSSALGKFQITDDTWNGLRQKHPQLGLTPDGRTDPAQAQKAAEVLTQENARVLQSAGIPVNDGTVYATHVLGAKDGPNVLNAAPETPMTSLVGPEVIAANPQFANMNAGQFAQWAGSKISGAAGQGRGMEQPASQQEVKARGLRGMSGQTIALLMSSPATREIATKLLSAEPKGKYSMVTLPDGTLAQQDSASGEIKVISKSEKNKPTTDIQEYNFAKEQGFPGTYLDFVRAKKGKGTMLRVDPDTGEIVFSQGDVESMGGRDAAVMGRETSKADAAMLKDERELARGADDMESLANQLEGVIGRVGYTGPGGDLYGRVDDVLGVLPGNTGARGAFRSLSMDAQLAMTQKTKGAITDREMGMFREAVPNLSQTPEGNQQIVKVMRGAARRVKARAVFMEEYLSRNKSLSKAQSSWNRYINENPLVEQTDSGISVREASDFTPYLDPSYAGKDKSDAGGAVQRPSDATRDNTPQPGQVEDGFRFKGGNPSDPTNWEQVQ